MYVIGPEDEGIVHEFHQQNFEDHHDTNEIIKAIEKIRIYKEGRKAAEL